MEAWKKDNILDVLRQVQRQRVAIKTEDTSLTAVTVSKNQVRIIPDFVAVFVQPTCEAVQAELDDKLESPLFLRRSGWLNKLVFEGI